jgi:hypothetical protein
MRSSVTFAGTIQCTFLAGFSSLDCPIAVVNGEGKTRVKVRVLSFTDKRNSIMTRLALSLSLLSLILTTSAGAQQQSTDRPFRTVHLVTLDAVQQAKLTGSIAQFNAAIVKAGFPNAQYHLYKVEGKQQGQYSLLWESSWSGQAEYDKIHSLPMYQQASAAFKNLMPLMKDEVYNRFVEIPTKQ